MGHPVKLCMPFAAHSAHLFVIVHHVPKPISRFCSLVPDTKQDICWNTTPDMPCEERGGRSWGDRTGSWHLSFPLILTSSELTIKKRSAGFMQRLAETVSEKPIRTLVWITFQFQGDQELLTCISAVWFALSQSAKTIVSQFQVPLRTYKITLTQPGFF